MNNGQKSLSINETFIIEAENDGTMSACTGFFTNALVSCTGNTQILLGTNIIQANSAFSATTFYGDGSNLTGISTQDTFVTGGTYDQNSGVATFTNNTGGTFSVTGFYTGATDVFVTAVTFTNNLLTLYRNDGATFGTTIDNFTSLNVNGPVSATTFYGDGSNLSGVSKQDIFVTGGTYSGGEAIFTNNTGGTFNVVGFYTGATDVFVTGGTYFDGVTTFINNTGGTFTIDGPSNYNAGVIFGAENWINNADGSIDLPEIKVALYDNPNNLELLKIYTVPSGTTGVGGIPALANNDTNYIIVEYNGGSPRYNVLDNDGTVTSSDVVLYMIVYRANNFVHTLEFGDMGAGLPNKLNTRLISTDRFARESGCALGLSGSTGIVTLSSGVVWNGPYKQIVTAVNSQDDIFFKSFHSGGTWVYNTTGNTINNDYYDNGTDLVLATAGKYLVNWYFRGQEVNDHLYELISYGEYDTIQLAEASPEPNLPELITSHAFLVGRIIVEVSATTGITQSAFNTVFQPSGAPVLHNDLAGIQGGIAGEYYHLDSNKYNNLALTNTNNNFSVGQSFNAGLTANTISATTYQNLPLDIRVTGATKSGAVATFTNNTGGTFTLTGLTDTFVTGATKSGTVATFRNNSGGTFTLTGLTDTFVTGGTHSSSTGITTFRNNTGGTFNVSGYFKPSDDIYVTGGTVTHGPNTGQNDLILFRSNGINVEITDLVNIYNITLSDMLGTLSNGRVIRGKTYKISGCDSGLYYNGLNANGNAVYTTIYLMGLEGNKMSESGVGVFYTPKYDSIPIFEENVFYASDTNVIWGGYVWKAKNDYQGNSFTPFQLDPLFWTPIFPFGLSNEYNQDLYNINYDDIIYDIDNDKIIYRNEQNTNIVSTSIENIDYWVNVTGLGHPIMSFQWGNLGRIRNQIIINSYNENINFNGLYQKDFYFEGLCYMKYNFVDSTSYQKNFYFKNMSYQINTSVTGESYQDSIRLTDNSYLNNIIIHNVSFQSNIELNNQSYFQGISLNNKNSYQRNLKFDNLSYQNNIVFGESCYQDKFVFDNGSFQNEIVLSNNGKIGNQENFNFTNGSYQSSIALDSNTQELLNFNRGAQYSLSINKGQTKINIENGEQIGGGNLTDAQDNITIKGYTLDWNTYPSTSPQNDLFFINDLPSKVTTTLIGKDNNQLIEVSNLYYDGSKWIADEISATTISATTYNGYIPASTDDSIINAIIFG